MNREQYRNPANADRPYMIQHAGRNFETVIRELARAGFGGVVMNCEWHTSQDDTSRYLENKEDFEDLDRRIEIAGAGASVYGCTMRRATRAAVQTDSRWHSIRSTRPRDWLN